MFWADRVAKEIIESRKYKPYWVDDMKTPSGRIHVGSLAGVVYHDLIYKALIDAGIEAKFTYVFEDHDPMDALPHYLERKKWSKYLGQPLFTIPSPDGKAENYARFYANEFRKVFEDIGCKPEIIWVSKLYKDGKMNNDIRLCLNKADVIRGIYEEVYKKKMPQNWYPFQVVCPNCGKESTTKVNAWDGEKVSFCCQIEAVDWTKGCGICGKISPLSGNGKYAGKLPWKVEWGVKWKVIGVTIEGAGKDHMTAGGSHDVSSLVCQKVVNYQVPYAFAYEFFLVAGKKMSSSRGLGSSAGEVLEMIPAHLLRFLIVRSHINRAINFDPRGLTVPDLFDEYDRCWKAYIDKSDEDLARIYEFSQPTDFKVKPLRRKIFISRFRTVTQVIQFPNVDPYEYFSQEKGGRLTRAESNLLLERIKYAKLWLKSYAPEEARFTPKSRLPKEADKLSDKQRKYLSKLTDLVEKFDSPKKLQNRLYQLAKSLGLSSREAFSAIYVSFLGKPHGPKAAWLIDSMPKDFVIKRLKEAGLGSKLI